MEYYASHLVFVENIGHSVRLTVNQQQRRKKESLGERNSEMHQFWGIFKFHRKLGCCYWCWSQKQKFRVWGHNVSQNPSTIWQSFTCMRPWKFLLWVFFVQVQSFMCEVVICGGLEFSCASFICELLVHAVSMGVEK